MLTLAQHTLGWSFLSSLSLVREGVGPAAQPEHTLFSRLIHTQFARDIREEVTCAAARLPLASAPSMEANRSYVHSDPAHVMGPATLSRECPYSDHSPGGKPVRTVEAHMRASVHGRTRAHTPARMGYTRASGWVATCREAAADVRIVCEVVVHGARVVRRPGPDEPFQILA